MSNITKTQDKGGFIKKGFHEEQATWYVDYDVKDDTTALVIAGSDGIGVFFLVLKGDKTEEFKNVADKSRGFNKGIYGELGECIRFACQHKDLIVERCTIGGVFSTKLKIEKLHAKFKYR